MCPFAYVIFGILQYIYIDLLHFEDGPTGIMDTVRNCAGTKHK